jgi:hypothetical protein
MVHASVMQHNGIIAFVIGAAYSKLQMVRVVSVSLPTHRMKFHQNLIASALRTAIGQVASIQTTT